MFLFGKLEIQDVEKDWKKTDLITLKKKKQKKLNPCSKLRSMLVNYEKIKKRKFTPQSYTIMRFYFITTKGTLGNS